MRWWALLLALVPAAAVADVAPVVTRDDSRVAVVRYTADQPVRITTAPGSNLTILLGANEHIGTIKLSDYARFQVTISQARDSLVLHTSAVTYQGDNRGTGSMVLSSDAHEYTFVLASAVPQEPVAYVLRFAYDRPNRAGRHQAKGDTSPQYKLTGSREVRPSSLTDDGAKTFIQWPADAAIPAVFALEHGREEMVNGFERGGVFTIDRVHQHLVFRIDKWHADAVRRASGRPL